MNEYQLTELFGWFDGTEATGRLINCHICGCVVQYNNHQMEIHRNWHNKVADL